MVALHIFQKCGFEGGVGELVNAEGAEQGVAAHAGDQALASESVKQLDALATGSHNRVILSSYNGAAGTLLIDQKKYEDAISYLEEDQDNPFTVELLIQAYYQTGESDKLHEAEARLRGTNVPTMEQALVVPAVRLKRPQI